MLSYLTETLYHHPYPDCGEKVHISFGVFVYK